MERSICIPTPVGPLTITAAERAVTAIRFGGTPAEAPPPGKDDPAALLLAQAAAQLTEYFAGRRREFSLPLAPAGTPFQQEVRAALQRIPYGETRTYGEIAAQIGRRRACRAVGMANNRNPFAIVVPCHRVIGASGALTGYAGGLKIKEQLLRLEQAPTRYRQ